VEEGLGLVWGLVWPKPLDVWATPFFPFFFLGLVDCLVFLGAFVEGEGEVEGPKRATSEPAETTSEVVTTARATRAKVMSGFEETIFSLSSAI